MSNSGDAPESHRVFVYGSLLRGMYNHHRLSAASFECEARTPPRYAMLHLGRYPGLVAGRESVRGEVYRIDDAGLRCLDLLESAPEFYRRELRELADGSLAWLYELANPELYGDCPVVEGGNWRAFLRAQRDL